MNSTPSLPQHTNWTVQSVADNSGRRTLTISQSVIRPGMPRRNGKKRRPPVVLIVKAAPEELTAFKPVIRVRAGQSAES